MDDPDKRPARPAWLRVRLGDGGAVATTRARLKGHGLHTVCEEARCPNLGHCWSGGRATVLILGAHCTRACRFCSVTHHPPEPPDADEPARVAAAVAASGWREVVLTSVTRDDLPDGGAALWAETIRRVRAAVPGILVEVLIPDFGGASAALETVLGAAPDILGHNLETVPRLYAAVRPQADYRRSLELLRRAAAAGAPAVKTSLMLGLGETRDETLATLRDAREAGAAIVFLGQYLQPTPAHAPVVEFVSPDAFAALRREALDMGFGFVASAPLVRSSFHERGQAEYVRAHRGVSAAR